MREIIISRPGLFICIATTSFFLLLLIGFVSGLLYDRRRRDTVLARQHSSIKKLTADKDNLQVAADGYKARLKGIIQLATTSGSVEE